MADTLGAVAVQFNSDSDTAIGFEELRFSTGAGDDVVSADAELTLPVELDGGAGNDTLTGGAGNDWITSGTGVDVVNSGSGANVLVADLEDLVVGVAGVDVLDVHVFGTDNPDVVTVAHIDETTVRLTVNGTTYDYDRSILRFVGIVAGAGADSVQFATDVAVGANILECVYIRKAT